MPSPLRLLHLDTLPDGSLATPIRLSGQEGLSEDFIFHLQIITEKKLSQKDFIAHPLSVSLQHQGQTRYFQGIINTIQSIESPYSPLPCYQLSLVPQVSLLSLHHDCRQYQKKTVIDIAKFWFQYFGISQVDFSNINKQYPKMDYVVQYNESVWHFLKRLFAQHGIYYYFTFTKNQHRLNLADNAQAYQKNNAVWPLGENQAQHVQQYTVHHQPLRSSFTLINSNPNRSGKVLQHQESFNAKANANRTCYPGEFDNHSTASTLASLENERQQVFATHCEAKSNITTLGVNSAFCVDSDRNSTYLISQIHHEIKDDSAVPIKTKKHDSHYHNRVIGIPYSIMFRPKRIAPPSEPGTHTAVVTGPDGEEIHTNDKGQIKIKFHWDRHSLPDESSSDWVRTTQDWSGNGYGIEFVPRVGQEVLVKYENGDLNKPIVIGSVYNSTHQPPHSLPEQAGRSGFKSHSFHSQSNDANEIRFDDSANDEMIYLHAKKDLMQQSQKGHLVTVGNNHHITVAGDTVKAIQEGFFRSESEQKIALQAGPSSIIIDKNGVTMQASKVSLNDSEPEGLNHPDNATHWIQGRYLTANGKPIADFPYLITHADGTHAKGKTNQQGATDKLEGLHPGTATVEFGEKEKLEQQLAVQRKKLKGFLDSIVASVKKKATENKAMLAKEHWWEKVYTFAKAAAESTAEGINNTMKSAGHLVVAMFEDVGDILALDARINNDIATGNDYDLTKLYNHADKKVQAAIDGIESSCHKMHLLFEDEKTKSILESFAEDYYHNMDGLMILKDISNFVGGFIPAIILAIIVKNPAALGAGISQDIVSLTAKAQAIIEEILVILQELSDCILMKDVELNQTQFAYAGVRNIPKESEMPFVMRKAEHQSGGVSTKEPKPYEKSRPPYAKGQVESVWNKAKGKDGKVRDPNTGEELNWDKKAPRNGQWDMGHKRKFEYKKLHDQYMNGNMSKEEFLKQYRNPDHYQPESVNANRSRKHEAG